jgi:hypothetical protein
MKEYYLAILSEDSYKELSKKRKITLHTLADKGVHYLCEIPNNIYSLVYSNDFFNENVLEYETIDSLLNEYIFGIDEDEIDNVVLKNDIESFFKFRISALYNTLYPLEYDNVSEAYRFISENKFKKLTDVFIKNALTLNISKKDNDDIENFLDHIEKYIVKDYGVISFSSETSSSSFLITKKDTPEYKNILIEEPTIVIDERNGYSYMGGLNMLKNWLSITLDDQAVGSTYRVLVNDDRNNPFFKVYGFYLYKEDDSIVINQLTSEYVYDAYEKPEKNIIYCGYDEEDQILGFDKV